MTSRLVWSPTAEKDLLEIWGHIADQASVARADDQLRLIMEACEVLREWPLSGRSRDALVPGMRSIVSAPYVVFYRAGKTAVEVVRVLHGRRDIDAIFSDAP